MEGEARMVQREKMIKQNTVRYHIEVAREVSIQFVSEREQLFELEGKEGQNRVVSECKISK